MINSTTDAEKALIPDLKPEQSTADLNLANPEIIKDFEVKPTIIESEEPVIPTNPTIEVRNLNLFYGDHLALDQINLQIMPKKVTAFIGPSGCGKSTLLRTLNRMNDFINNIRIEGEVLIDDRDIYRQSANLEELRKQVGLVAQHPVPFNKSIYDNVAFGPRLFGIKDKEQLNEIVRVSLKKASLWKEVNDKLHTSAKDLSGGQQQRLCIARTLANNPQIILMDEPTSALDPGSTRKIEELIEELKEQYTIVIVTHNMQQAARIADTTAFFWLGKIIECDATDNIFNNPKNKLTRDYIMGKFG